MALVWVCCPPGPGSRLPSSQIEPSSEARKTHVVIMVLPVEEHMFLLEHVFWCGGEYTQDVQQRFEAQFPETKVPHRNAVQQLIQKFKETGSVCDTTKSGRPSILTEKKVLVSQTACSKVRRSPSGNYWAGWCPIWHSPYSFKKLPRPTPLQNYSCAWIETWRQC